MELSEEQKAEIIERHFKRLEQARANNRVYYKENKAKINETNRRNYHDMYKNDPEHKQKLKAYYQRKKEKRLVKGVSITTPQEEE
jgi:hypothetical protein